MAAPDRRVSATIGPLDLILSRLDGARKMGGGFRAKCPHCGGTSMKLSLGETSTGAVLLHCFGGCSPTDVLASVGLTLGDLFPIPLNPTTPEERREADRRMREVRWAAALSVLPKELAIVEIAARQLSKNEALDEEDRKRVMVAVDRILSARQALGVRDQHRRFL